MASASMDRKVIAGGIGGAVATILVWGLGELMGKEVPTFIAQAFQTLGVLGLQYFVPNASGGSNDSGG